MAVQIIAISSADVPVPTVELLIKELKDVVDDWKPLGGSLGIPVRKLDAIMLNDPNGGVENWKLKMFQFVASIQTRHLGGKM